MIYLGLEDATLVVMKKILIPALLLNQDNFHREIFNTVRKYK
jgi:hypothetical protein